MQFNVKPGSPYYRLAREKCHPGNKTRSDLCLERVRNNGAKSGCTRPRTLIEAKRTFLWTTKLDGLPDKVVSQKSKIQADIAKLRRQVKRELRRNRPNAPRGFVLVWNVTGFSGSDIGPLAYARTLAINPKKGDIFKIWQIKAVPLSPRLHWTARRRIGRWRAGSGSSSPKLLNESRSKVGWKCRLRNPLLTFRHSRARGSSLSANPPERPPNKGFY